MATGYVSKATSRIIHKFLLVMLWFVCNAIYAYICTTSVYTTLYDICIALDALTHTLYGKSATAVVPQIVRAY
jgi:hypothetical protein